MEVLSGLASSALLVAVLSDLYERVKNAPDRICQHVNHVKRLIEIILRIKETRSLHTTFVFAQLEYTIPQACSLRDLLVKVLGQYSHPSLRSRYWKVLKGKREKEILLALQNLERKKTALSLCLAASQTELLHEVRDEVRKAEPDMPEQGAPKLPQGQIIGSQRPPSPAPSAPDSEQVPRNETRDMESSDMERVDAVDKQKEMEEELGNIDIEVDKPKCSVEARQNNGVYAPFPVAAKIKVGEPTAEGQSLQNNGFVGFQSFWKRG